MPRNSAPISTNRPEALTKARIRYSTECTGLRDTITMTADAGEQIEEQCGNDHFLTSPVRRVEFDRFRKLALPAVAIGEQFRLVKIEFLAGLGREFEIRSLDDGIDRTGFLAQAAIDAFHHVDVVAHGAAGAVVPTRTGLDSDRLRRADRLAQLAGDAALLAVRIAAQRMLAAEARRDRPLLERVVPGL